MDIYVHGFPAQVSSKNVRQFFKDKLGEFGVEDFDCHKFKSKGCATLTVLNPESARRFLAKYGQTSENWQRRPPGRQPSRALLPASKLSYQNRPIYCSLSNRPSDELTLRTLLKDAKDRSTLAVTRAIAPTIKADRQYIYSSLACGVWSYFGTELVFTSHFVDPRQGGVLFGKTSLVLLAYSGYTGSQGTASAPYTTRIDFPYSSIEGISTGGRQIPSVTLTLSLAPRVFQATTAGIDELLQGMSIQPISRAPGVSKRERSISIGPGHEKLIGQCLIYRIVLSNGASIANVRQLLLQQSFELPPYIPLHARAVPASKTYTQELTEFMNQLCVTYDSLDFAVKFQVQKLSQNAFLQPHQVQGLLEQIAVIQERSGVDIAVQAVRKLFRQIDFAGPSTEAHSFALRNLAWRLVENEAAAKREERFQHHVTHRHSHMGLIHKVTITPAGAYLFGPVLETKNRVLRKYPQHINSFLRVTFSDEDNESIRCDRFVSLRQIFQERFKKVLENGIDIVGQKFEFLGFSHSSLREQTCWFMANFSHEGQLTTARDVVGGLGDFSHIQSPAKCAARIAQAFTETHRAVRIPSTAQEVVNDVERNDRVFSDGCGTFSMEIMRKIWKEYSSAQLKPTLFQIRYAGAKGMLSLDSRLKGERLCIRRSMIKFPSQHTELEICGGGWNTLPMYLNRQIIKILEDLGVSPDVFMGLQNMAVETLRFTTQSSVNASTFLEQNSIGKAASLPWLVRNLHYIGMSFLDDHFLRSAVEMVVLMQLRELKHRSRILVENGVTLLGILDESDSLAEGEIYCCTSTEVITGRVLITRSPALHPGDIQMVNAVEVPSGCILEELHNCIVFSQRGERDLPSQLSGGDLDGDLYNVIYHTDLFPKFTVPPADYPRMQPVDIRRPVERADITDFFLAFMENDRLGQIATQHQQLADLYGTLSEDCIKLANMHSTAVDFSKTGIPVDMAEAPRTTLNRPDFMAPSPRVQVEPNTTRFEVDRDHTNFADDEDEDVVGALDPDVRSYRYYHSNNVLGQLYRAIDEKEFLAELQGRAEDVRDPSQTLIFRIWEWVQHETIGVLWEHHQEWAQRIRDEYESNLVDTMYQFSLHPLQPLSEVEVFVGTVLGRSGGLPSRRLRDSAMSMKDKFNDDIAYTVSCIIKNADRDGESVAAAAAADEAVDVGAASEALERSIACLAVSLEDSTGDYVPERVKTLESFRYVAAAACLKEVRNFKATFGVPSPLF